MRILAGGDGAGYLHSAALYDTDEELIALAVAHLQAAVDVGDPAIAALPADQAVRVRTAMDAAASAVTFLPDIARERPPAVITRLRSLLGGLLEGGAEYVRVVSTVPHPGLGAPWDGWCRYEAAVNTLLSDMPLWGLCLYDRRITPRPVLDDVERTHASVTRAGRHVPNDRYQDPSEFLRTMPAPPPDPLEANRPDAEFVNPSPADSRQAVRALGPATRLSSDEVDALVMATSEAVTNAVLHGRPPVTLRVWAAQARIVVTVTDRGPGPEDPYAGLVPHAKATTGRGGYGLWLINNLATVAYRRDAEGFTIQLVGGDPLPLHHGSTSPPDDRG